MITRRITHRLILPESASKAERRCVRNQADHRGEQGTKTRQGSTVLLRTIVRSGYRCSAVQARRVICSQLQATTNERTSYSRYYKHVASAGRRPTSSLYDTVCRARIPTQPRKLATFLEAHPSTLVESCRSPTSGTIWCGLKVVKPSDESTAAPGRLPDEHIPALKFVLDQCARLASMLGVTFIVPDTGPCGS